MPRTQKTKYSIVINTNLHSNHKNKLKYIKFALRWLDIFQQFTFIIKQKKQHTNLNISNNTNRCDKQKQ